MAAGKWRADVACHHFRKCIAVAPQVGALQARLSRMVERLWNLFQKLASRSFQLPC